MALFRSFLNLGRWRGAQPNALVNGLVDVRIGAAVEGLVGIRSIQHGLLSDIPGTIGDTATVTVDSVDLDKTILIAHYNARPYYATARLTNSTTITATSRSTISSDMIWLLLEFY